MSDQSVAETSTWQHTTLTTNIHAPGGIRTHDRRRRAAVDLRGLLEKYPTFGREKETGLPGALDT